MTLGTTRGEILRGIIEGTLFHVKETVESITSAGVAIDEFRAVGGGSKSATWVGMCADIFGRPVVQSRVAEAGCLGPPSWRGLAVARSRDFPKVS
jgi:xylulokinase